MNDLTSFIFATVRNSQWHDMESPIMLDMLRDMQDKARMKKIDFAVAGVIELRRTLNHCFSEICTS